MAQEFAVGDRVAWNEEHNELRGRIIRVVTGDVEYGVRSERHATPDEPQYEVQHEDKDERSMHRQSLLHRI